MDKKQVKVGDIISLNLWYEDEEKEELEVKLTAGDSVLEEQIVSVKSKLGELILDKAIGYKGSYSIDNQKTEVEIVDIIKNQKVKTK